MAGDSRSSRSDEVIDARVAADESLVLTQGANLLSGEPIAIDIASTKSTVNPDIQIDKSINVALEGVSAQEAQVVDSILNAGTDVVQGFKESIQTISENQSLTIDSIGNLLNRSTSFIDSQATAAQETTEKAGQLISEITKNFNNSLQNIASKIPVQTREVAVQANEVTKEKVGVSIPQIAVVGIGGFLIWKFFIK